uniref:DBF4-type domain-containing protein n=1 Tax=Parastrongyloides trichosuri TaxID=131310 RepID=A0A0N4Z9U6_PARTI
MARWNDGKSTNVNLSAAIDIIGAELDQTLIKDYFRVPRKERVHLRDFFNPINPPLPLRIKFQDKSIDCKDEISAKQLLIYDSSDDEKDEKIKAKKKKKTPFENCYLCKLDPTAQHLHVLGNQSNTENNNENNIKEKTHVMYETMTSPFYESNKLYVS